MAQTLNVKRRENRSKLPTVEKQGQTVHMLQLFGIYIPLARLYIYLDLYNI